MERLRSAIAKAKAGQLGSRDEGAAADAKQGRRPHEDGATEEEIEAMRIEAMERKARTYEHIVQGRSRYVPPGALVDFEAITGERLHVADQDRQTSRNSDDAKSRSGAAIAPPPQLLENVIIVHAYDSDSDRERYRGGSPSPPPVSSTSRPPPPRSPRRGLVELKRPRLSEDLYGESKWGDHPSRDHVDSFGRDIR